MQAKPIKTATSDKKTGKESQAGASLGNKWSGVNVKTTVLPDALQAAGVGLHRGGVLHHLVHGHHQEGQIELSKH